MSICAVIVATTALAVTTLTAGAAVRAAGFFLATGLAGLRAGTALRAAPATFTLAGATFVAGAGDLATDLEAFFFIPVML
jgi:hypothetical protein